ncbi:glycosyltransferase family protein [Pseudobutyrivibrio xylanivorans]|uniref:6-pyruvoyl-tetrahydropterin synthase related domain membrane protein n=1 Tax=Pseudobutyrivibrio xylanivorans DSM 14809 TaxID=1123012 RepID=A0A1M6GV39_PSEXY|nr:hypothetical protein [Pseudobutyrivibrio xylanivorans]SHJ13828.1 hypothetical protein SAMN02745725_01834 [Pseudobutyrivibrio xylanivorans DSM 14809]
MKKKWIGCLIIIFELFMTVLLAYKASKPNELIHTSLDNWQSSFFKFQDGSWQMKDEFDHDANTIDLVGPFITVGRGSYDVIIEYSADKDGTVVINSGAKNADRLLSRDCDLKANEHVTNICFEAKETVENLGIGIFYGGSGSMEINNITIYRNRDMQKRWLAEFVFFALFFNIVYLKREWLYKNKKLVASVLSITILASMPIFSWGHGLGHDLEFHLMRIEGIKEELLAGHFPVRMQSLWNSGYGYPVSIYYGDFLLYFPALLRIMGFRLLTVYKINVFIMNLCTSIFSYLLGKRLWKKDYISLAFSAAYTLATYRIVCVFVRSALGEYSAIMFLPILVLGIYETYFAEDYEKDNKKFNHRGAIYITIGMTSIITSHILSTEMICIVLLVFVLIYWKKTIKKEVICTIAVSIVSTILLTIWFTVPFIDYYKNVSVNINKTVDGGLYIQKYGAFITQYFAVFKTLFGGGTSDIISMRPSVTPGLLLMTTLLLGIGLWVNDKADSIMKKLIISSVAFLFIASNIFPWDVLSGNRIGNLLVQIQFPFRYLTFACMTMTLLFGYIVAHYDGKEDMIKKSVYGLLFVAFFIQVTFDISSYANDVVSIYNPMYITDLSMQNVTEYYRAGSDYKELAFEVTGQGMDKGYLVENKGTDYVFEIEMVDSGKVTLPIMNYKGYIVYDDNGNRYDIFDGEQKEIAITLSEDFSGYLYVSFVEPFYWRIAEIISILYLFICIIFLFKNKGKIFGE